MTIVATVIVKIMPRFVVDMVWSLIIAVISLGLEFIFRLDSKIQLGKTVPFLSVPSLIESHVENRYLMRT